MEQGLLNIMIIHNYYIIITGETTYVSLPSLMASSTVGISGPDSSFILPISSFTFGIRRIRSAVSSARTFNGMIASVSPIL